MVSEELEELFEVTDRLHVINGGRLSPPLTTADVTPNDIGKYMIGRQHADSQDSQHAV